MKSAKSIRWTLNRAALEFGCDPKTVAKGIRARGTLPGPDGKFSTVEIHSALCGDKDREQVRKLKEEADGLALANATRRGELMEVEDFLRAFEPAVIQMKSRILASSLTATEQDAVLNDMSRIASAATYEDPK